MPRYFFHTANGQIISDDEGTDLPDLGAAQDAALKLLGEMIRDDRTFWLTCLLTIQVTDDCGLALFTLDTAATLSPAILSSR